MTLGAVFTPLWFKDMLERVGKSALQAFIAVIILHGTYSLDVVQAAAIAGLTAALTVVKAILATVIPSDLTPASFAAGRLSWFTDVVERLLFTFIEAFVSALLVGTSYNLSILRSAALAGLAAALSVLSSMLSASKPAISPASLVSGVGVEPARRA